MLLLHFASRAVVPVRFELNAIHEASGEYDGTGFVRRAGRDLFLFLRLEIVRPDVRVLQLLFGVVAVVLSS